MTVRVFLIEDQKRMQDLILDLLDSIGGFEVVATAATETAATEWLLRHEDAWDIAIIDLLLGEGTGFNMISRCSRHGSGSVVVFSDFVTPVVQQRCLRLGADGVISKAQFRELRAYLQCFPGRMPEPATA